MLMDSHFLQENMVLMSEDTGSHSRERERERDSRKEPDEKYRAKNYSD